ncbi:MAG: bifunctional oligoribonuclease/PAP phosphatase NrnA [Salinirussus sp.]
MSHAGPIGATLRDVTAGLVPVVGDNPAVVAAVAVAIGLVLTAGAWLSLRRFRRTIPERFLAVLEGFDAVSVLMHPTPDPDAMSSALAVEELAATVDTDVRLQYHGDIGHQENRAFQTVLDGEFDRIEDADDIDGEAVVLVDHNEPRGFKGAGRIDPVAIVDHHPGDGEGTAFTDVRDERGSCASIFAEYFSALGWDPVDADDPEAGADARRRLPEAVATGLLHGIHTDTRNLTSGCSAGEFEAVEYLYPGVDGDLFDRIANPPVDADTLDVKARAIQDRDVRAPFAVSDVGEVSNVDAIPQAAEELLGLEGVDAVVVVGEHDDELRLSGRSRDDRVHMGKTLQAAVDDIPMSGAGGHARSGGGQLSVPHLNGLRPSSGLTREEFVDRLFAAMRGEIRQPAG